MKIKAIPIFILTEIFPYVHETCYLRVMKEHKLYFMAEEYSDKTHIFESVVKARCFIDVKFDTVNTRKTIPYLGKLNTCEDQS